MKKNKGVLDPKGMGASDKPKWEGQLENPVAAIEDALVNIDENYPRSWVYIDALNQIYRDIQAQQQVVLTDERAGKSALKALKNFDDELKRLNALGTTNRKFQTRTKSGGKKKERSDKNKRKDKDGRKGGCGEKGEDPAEGAKRRRLNKTQIYPKDCHPEPVWLEFAPKKSDWHAKGIAWKDADNIHSDLKTGHRTLRPPGWLTDLSLAQIKTVNKIRKYLSTLPVTDDVSNAVDHLHSLVSELGVKVTKPEITRALRWLPAGKKEGLDYRVFLLALGDFNYADSQGALRSYPRKFKCKPEQDDSGLYGEGTRMKALHDELTGIETFFEVDTKSMKPPKYEIDPPPFPLREKMEYVPIRERQPMEEWRKQVIIDRDKAAEQEAKWAEEILKKRAQAMTKAREAYAKELKEKREREEQERRRKEEEAKRIQALRKRLIKKFMDQGYSRHVAEKKAHAYFLRLQNEKVQKARMVDKANYTDRQKKLWTGLFLTEMYDAMELVEYYHHNPKASVPHKVAPRDEVLYQQWRRDYCERKANAPSPYLSPLAVVTNRVEKYYPGDGQCRDAEGCENKVRSRVKHDHWILDLPEQGEGRLFISENRFRTRQILDYVVHKDGSALCLLPRVDLLLHFAHNLADQILRRPDPRFGPCKSGTQVEEKKSETETKNTSVMSSVKSFFGKIFGKSSKEKNDDGNNRPQSAPAKSSTSKESVKTLKRSKSETAKDKMDIAPFRDPARPKPVPESKKSKCGAGGKPGTSKDGEGKKPNICDGANYMHPQLSGFKTNNNVWVRRHVRTLYRPLCPTGVRPKEDVMPFRNLTTFRGDMAQAHKQDWNAYNCRRYHLRKDLWDNMNVAKFRGDDLRENFANCFWSLLPRENQVPRALLNTIIENPILRPFNNPFPCQ